MVFVAPGAEVEAVFPGLGSAAAAFGRDADT
jgi:hypothetical protein